MKFFSSSLGKKALTKNINSLGTKVLTLAIALSSSIAASAQAGDLNQGITQARDQITGSFDAIETLVYAIAAILALVGAIRVYGKFVSGDPDTAKAAMGWFGAAIFLIVATFAIKSFFGIA